MRYGHIIFALALGFPGIAPAADLSSKSSEYLRKLSEFELEQVTAARAEIRKKRYAVVAILNLELKELTRKGDSDRAAALKKAIDAIRGEVKLDEIRPVREARKDAKEGTKALEKRLVGQVWKVRTRKFLFEKRGKIVLMLDGKGIIEQGLWQWEATGPDVAEIKSSTGTILKFTFKSDTEGEQEWFKGGKSQSVTPATRVQ